MITTNKNADALAKMGAARWDSQEWRPDWVRCNHPHPDISSGGSREIRFIDADLRFLVAARRADKELSGRVLSSALIDALLDERASHRLLSSAGCYAGETSLTRELKLSGSTDIERQRWDRDRVIRYALAAAALVVAVPACMFSIRFLADLLARILPTRVAEALFPSTPNPRGVPIGDTVNPHQLFGMAFFVILGSRLFHRVRRYRRAKKLQQLPGATRGAVVTPSHSESGHEADPPDLTVIEHQRTVTPTAAEGVADDQT